MAGKKKCNLIEVIRMAHEGGVAGIKQKFIECLKELYPDEVE